MGATVIFYTEPVPELGNQPRLLMKMTAAGTDESGVVNEYIFLAEPRHLVDYSAEYLISVEGTDEVPPDEGGGDEGDSGGK